MTCKGKKKINSSNILVLGSCNLNFLLKLLKITDDVKKVESEFDELSNYASTKCT